ncbi:hypothetical protein COTS27_01370 [Spirochaetota bacterium]|nr:hypothetical protein COTS27_01370 [Spirochaetota bacterium]
MAGDYRRICRTCAHAIASNRLCYKNYRHNTSGGFMKGFPYVCTKCSHPLAGNFSTRSALRSVKHLPCWVCGHKWIKAKGRNPLLADKLVVLFYYTGAVKQLIHYYKFFKHPSYAALLTQWALAWHRDFFKKFDVCVPIVLSSRDKFHRDFCPVNRVVHNLMHALGIPVLEVIKKRYASLATTRAQHFLKLQERYASVRSRFYYDPKYNGALVGKRVLLIDDVYTTGATINAATELIKNHNTVKKKAHKTPAGNKQSYKVKNICAFAFSRSVLTKTPATWRSQPYQTFSVKTSPTTKIEDTSENNWTFFT